MVFNLPETLFQALVAIFYLKNGQFETVLHCPEVLGLQTQLILHLANLILKTRLLSRQVVYLGLLACVKLLHAVYSLFEKVDLTLITSDFSLKYLYFAFVFSFANTFFWSKLNMFSTLKRLLTSSDFMLQKINLLFIRWYFFSRFSENLIQPHNLPWKSSINLFMFLILIR